MDCQEAQDRVLARMEVPASVGANWELGQHITSCPECSAFARLQQELDDRLRRGIPALPRLGTDFRRALRVRRMPQRRLLSQWIPEVAHFGGCAVAIGFCALVMPFPLEKVVETGIVLAAGGYLLETVVAGVLEETQDAGL